MKTIKLTKGYEAIVDDEDYEKVSAYKWFVLFPGSGKGKPVAQNNMPGSHRRHCYMHRLIMCITNPKISVDHINGNTLDNRKSNLRLCNQSQNGANSIVGKNNKSGFKGVCWDKRNSRWMATITFMRKSIFIGRYHSKKEAALSYNNAAIKYFGEFARLNVIPQE